MSIQSEITRITNKRDASFSAVAAKGVIVPSGSTIDDLPDLIAQIQQGGGSAVVVTEELDENGGTIATITAVDISNDTVDAAHLLSGYTAHNRFGEEITGSYITPVYTSQAKSNITPTTSSQTITPDSGYDGLSSVQINAMPSGSAGTPVATKGTVSSHSVSVTPSVTNTTGYITGSTKTGTAVTVTAAELVSGTKSITANGTGIDVTNYADVDVTVTPSLQSKTGVTPSTSSQTISPDTGYDGLSSVQIDAMPSGTAGTPVATKGTVSSHSITVTPSVTNTTGYITGSTKTGTAVTVAASELVSGTKSITANGTGIDVTNYALVDVAIPLPVPNLQAKTNISPTTSSQTIEADSGYDGLSSIQINAMPSGSATAPASISGSSATVSTGTNTLTLTKTVSVTPTVSAGYVSSGTAGNSSVSLTASVITKAAATITPTKSTQTIASGTYLTGTQTIAAIPAAYQDVTSVTAAAGDVVSGKAIVNSSGTVVNGTLVIQHYYTGSGAPSSLTGVDGDIYLQTS